MQTKFQELHSMLSIDEVLDIEKHLKLNDIEEYNKQLIKLFNTKSVYITEGTYGEIPIIEHLPVPYQSFIDEIMKIKSKNTLMYGGEVSLFKIVAYTIKGHDNCYHQIFRFQVNDYLEE